MQMPRLRLPSFLGWFSGRPLLLYTLYTVVVFLAFVVYTFPDELVVERALELVRNPHVDVTARERNFAWFRGMQLAEVRVSSLPLREGTLPYLELSELRVRPDYGALLRGDYQTFRVFADLYGGEAHGMGGRDDGTFAGQLEWSGLDLGRYRTLRQWISGGDLKGDFSGAVDFQTNGAEAQAVLDLLLTHAALEGGKVKGITVPDLHFREARTRATVQGSRVTIEDFSASGDEMNIQGSGEIVLREPRLRSSLDLRVTLQPGKKNKTTLQLVLALLPRPAAQKEKMPIVITGTLGRPMVR